MEMDKMHTINVGKKGTLKPSGQFQSTTREIEALIKNIRQENTTKITLYFHGGLVNEEAGVEGANFMNAQLKAAGNYPVSFVWETGWGETVKERIFTINKTTLFKKLLKFVIKRAGAKLGLGVGTRGFMQYTDAEIEEELSGAGVPFLNVDELHDNRSQLMGEMVSEEDFLEELKAELEIDMQNDDEFVFLLEETDPRKSLVNEELIEGRDEDGSRGVLGWGKLLIGLAKVAYRVIKRYLENRDHGFYPTVLEEVLREIYIANLGAWLWYGMQEKAREMWLPNGGRTGTNQYAGTYFLERLDEYAKEQPLEINLLGHSAGSIAICHLLQNIEENYSNLRINNVLFLAPACRSDLFLDEMVDNPDRFKKFRMFTMTDEFEAKDALINGAPGVYPRSLLYLISGILENEGKTYDNPVLGMERYYKWPTYTEKFDNLKKIKEFLTEKEDRVVLSPTSGNPEGFNSQAQDHGKFNEDDETLKSIQYILLND